ncbi:MAG TPA: FxsA family protein [Chromatiales bacterium]|nr:FxsA family protein [Chromatiales bacterium]
MPVFRYLLLLFLLVPLIEIYFLIKVGDVIGAGWTVFLVVFTAVVGVWLLRVQGLGTLYRVQASLEQGELPATAMLEGMLLLVAGALLLTPGFVTDTIGFLLLVPPLRHRLAAWLLFRGVLQAGMPPPRRPGPGSDHGRRTIEGEYKRRDE